MAPPEAAEPVAVSIVVPCYRSGEWLPDLVARVVATMDGTRSSFEVILINDASPDTTTWPAIEGLAAQHPEVRGIDLLGNVGQFRSTLCGFEATRGEVVVTIDDDLQNPPEEIPKLLDALDADPALEVVVGSLRAQAALVVPEPRHQAACRPQRQGSTGSPRTSS